MGTCKEFMWVVDDAWQGGDVGWRSCAFRSLTVKTVV